MAMRESSVEFLLRRGRVDLLVVGADHERGNVVGFGRSGKHHAFGAGLEVHACLVAVEEDAGAFEHHVHLHIGPGQFKRVAYGKACDFLAVHGNAGGVGGYRAVETAVHGVVLEQVGEGFVVGQVVDGNDFDVCIFQQVAEREATNAAEAVDSNAFFCHT